MPEPYALIVLCSLVIGLAAGFVMHRSDFCVTASFRDIFLFRDFFLMRQMILLVFLSMVLFEAGRLAGLIALYPFPLLGPPSFGNVVGGFVFGIGMVLAGGCVCGSLYKFGAGSAVSLVAVLGMLAGSAGYAEIYPQWAAFANDMRLLDSQAVTLPQLMNVAPTTLVLPFALGLGVWLLREFRSGRMVRPGYTAGHVAPWRAAVILALCGFVSYLVIGMPMGITTAYAKLGATVESLLAPDHVRSLAYFAAEPLHYTPPFAQQAISGGAGPALDAIAAIQYPLIFGIVGGALFSSMRLGELKLSWRLPARQFASALIGGGLLGVGARMSPSCNIWHIWGGLPILAMVSLLFVAGLVPGTWVGTRLLTRFVIR